MEYRLRRGDGEYWLVLDSGVPRFAPDGAFAGYIGSCLDLTERKKAEDELRQSEASLQLSTRQNQALAGRLITAQEDERQRIARDLHDDFNQRLALLSVETEMLGHSKSDLDIGALSGRLAAQLRELSSDVHKLSHRLHPAKVDQLGLVYGGPKPVCRPRPAVRASHRVFCPECSCGAPSAVSLSAYRIIQESPHSRAGSPAAPRPWRPVFAPSPGGSFSTLTVNCDRAHNMLSVS